MKFPGPALAVDRHLQVLAANVHAGLLEESLKTADSPVATLLQRTLAHNAPITHKVTLRGKAGVHHVDLIALPAKVTHGKHPRTASPAVYLLAKDTTLEQNLTQALVDSRQMFKDLLSCTAAFAWETDSGGVLRYVSPKGAFGYAAHEMTGRLGRDFLVSGRTSASDPFAANDRIDDADHQVWRADGSMATVQISAVPVIAQDGSWQGARGICRDISAERERMSAFGRLARTEMMSSQILALAGGGMARRELIHRAAAIISDVCEIPCAVFIMEEDELFSHDPQDLAKQTSLRPMIAALMRHDGPGSKSMVLSEPGGSSLLVTPIRLGPTILGAMAVSLRDQQSTDASASAPFELAANALGLVLDHARLQTANARAPGMGDLHTLLKGPELIDKLTVRLESVARPQSPSHFLVLELDGFLAAMTRIDPAISEAILNDFAAHLKQSTRSHDLAAWLGDGQFAVWLDNSDIHGAVKKIEQWKTGLREILTTNGLGKGILAVSAGIAGWPAAIQHGGSASALMALATSALNDAKRKGRGHWGVAQNDSVHPAKNTQKG